MRQFKTKWGRKTLHWFWSGCYWYVTSDKPRTVARPIAQHRLTGCGKTKDEAFLEFRQLSSINQPIQG